MPETKGLSLEELQHRLHISTGEPMAVPAPVDGARVGGGAAV